MSFGKSLAAWLRDWVKHLTDPKLLIVLFGSTASAGLGYYARLPIPAFWTPLSVTFAVLATMLFYQHKERRWLAEKPLRPTAEHLDIGWIYETKDGQLVGKLIPVCPKCEAEVRLAPNLAYALEGYRYNRTHAISGVWFLDPVPWQRRGLFNVARRLIECDLRKAGEI